MTVPAAVLALAMTVGGVTPGHAQAVHVPPPASPVPRSDEPPFENPYRVINVLVDRRAANAAQAREQAIRDGQRLAWRRLVERLAPPAAQAEHARPPDSRIDELFDYFEVQRERISGTRYAAILTYVFKPDQVRSLLNRNDLPTRAEVIRREQEQRNRDEEPLDRPPVSRLTARVPVNSMNDLIQIRQRLGSIPLVRRADQISLTRTEALFELHYVGEESVLTEALRQQDLGLARLPEGWSLTVAPTGSLSALPPGTVPPAPVPGGAPAPQPSAAPTPRAATPAQPQAPQGTVRAAPDRPARPPSATTQ